MGAGHTAGNQRGGIITPADINASGIILPTMIETVRAACGSGRKLPVPEIILYRRDYARHVELLRQYVHPEAGALTGLGGISTH